MGAEVEHVGGTERQDLVPKAGGKEGEMEEWDLVEELFNWIYDAREEEED